MGEFSDNTRGEFTLLTTMQGGPPVPKFEAVAKAFTVHYYATFDRNRGELSALYMDHSMLTFEGAKIMGKQAIHAKLTEGIKFAKSRHRIQTLDAQPSSATGIIVFVGGEILVDEEEKPLRFSQVFHLQPLPNNPASVYIHNDMFRLHYG